MPPKKVDKGKGISIEQIHEKSTIASKEPKTEPWITVTKKTAKREDVSNDTNVQSPEVIMEEIRKLQKAFEKSLSKQEEGTSSKKPSSQIISKIPDIPSVLNQSQFPNQISKSSNNSQIVLKENLQNSPSEYFEKPIYQNIITVEKGYFHNDPFQTIEKLFGKNQFFKPYHKDKTAEFYQNILNVTGSVTFKHFYLAENHADPAYSTLRIHKIVAPSDWEYDLNTPLKFPENYKDHPCYDTPFNNWDYCQAWFNSFLIQSPKHKHTWLIFFDKEFDLSKSPYWFTSWWNNYGSTIEIIKPQIQKSFQIFKSTFIPTENEKKFPHLALFHSKCRLPWVLFWTLEFSSDSIPILRRKFKVKWWDKFKIPSEFYPSNIPNWIKAENSNFPNSSTQNQLPIQTPETTHFLAQKSQMLSMLAAAKSEEEIKAISLKFLPTMTKQNSQASSNSSSNIPDFDADDLDD